MESDRKTSVFIIGGLSTNAEIDLESADFLFLLCNKQTKRDKKYYVHI